jgi:hypothetical protein
MRQKVRKKAGTERKDRDKEKEREKVGHVQGTGRVAQLVLNKKKELSLGFL